MTSLACSDPLHALRARAARPCGERGGEGRHARLVCDMNCPEGQEHFIVECPAYTDQHILLFRAASGYINDFYTISTQVKTIEILKLCAYNFEIGKIVHAMYI